MIGVVTRWVDGHRHPDNTPRLDADYGDLISFRHHMEAEADRRGKDILYLNSGDLVDVSAFAPLAALA